MGELTLLLPGLLGPLPKGARSWDALEQTLPALARLLARGRAETSAPSLEDLFRLRSEADALPAAALGYLGEGRSPGDHAWLRADPVYLRADQDRLMVFSAHGLDLRVEEAAALIAELNRLLAEDGMELYAPVPERWYLRLPATPSLQTVSTLTVSGRYADAFVPRGKDAGRFSRLGTELQMLLHMSEVNARREQRGAAPINSVWFWGPGSLPKQVEGTWSRVYSNDPVVLGLAKQAEIAAEPLPSQLDRSGLDGSTLLTDDTAERALASGDLDQWLRVVRELEQRWLAPAVEMLAAGAVESLLLSTNERAVRVKRSMLKRFWRRGQPLKNLIT